jgi:hypothetical protein
MEELIIKLEIRRLLITALLCLQSGAALAQGGILIYCRQPTAEPPYKQIHRLNADGTGDTTLSAFSNGLNYPDWSPDASKIAACGYVSSTVWSIYAMNADGSGLTRLTNTANAYDAEPDWSPDGSRIVFARRDPANFEDEKLWLMNADGSDLHPLNIAGSAPCWSPDGTRLLYQSIRGGNYGLYAADLDGANETTLAVSAGHEMFPAWSPDGTKIAFVSTRDGNPEIYVMNADGSGQTRLTFSSAGDFDPAWSPDGSLIAFDSDASGSDHWEIYLIRADGTNLRRLTYLPSNATAINPDWKPQDLLYLGRPRPGLTPVRFAPDSLCANDDWFWHGAPIFSPDLKEIYWTRYAIYPTYQRTELMQMKLDENRWSQMQRSSFADSNYTENNPCFSTSNDTLYFYSQRAGGPRLRVTRTPSGWSAPAAVTVPPLAGLQSGFQFSLARNGALYFELWDGPSCDLYRSERVGGVYQTPEALAALNTSAYEFCPYVDPAERFIIFDSNRPGGFGFNDLYISIRDEAGAWGEPVNLGPTINSSTEDASPYITPDGLYFFFVTEKTGDAGYNPYWLDARFIYDLLPDSSTATLLQSMDASCRNGRIEVSWTLSEIDEGVEFDILRAAVPGRGFEVLPAAAIEQNGLAFVFRDATVEPGKVYRYRVQYHESREVRVLFETDPVTVSALRLALWQNAPNPFNPTTVIRYDRPARGRATLAVYDVRGAHVRTLLDRVVEGGSHQTTWDGLDSRGNPASSGLYFCRLTAGKRSIARKMLLLR